MADLKLISTTNRRIKPLVKAALENELRLLEAGIRQTKQSLQKFEEKYHMSTQDFFSGYQNDELRETLEFAEWIGEYRLLERLKEKADILRDIRFAPQEVRPFYLSPPQT